MIIAPDDNCFTEFESLKFRRNDSRFIVFKIDDDKIVSFFMI